MDEEEWKKLMKEIALSIMAVEYEPKLDQRCRDAISDHLLVIEDHLKCLNPSQHLMRKWGWVGSPK